MSGDIEKKLEQAKIICNNGRRNRTIVGTTSFQRQTLPKNFPTQ